MPKWTNRATALAATAALLAGCTSINGPVDSLNDYGPVKPKDGKSNDYAPTAAPLFIRFRETFKDSYDLPGSGQKARAMVVAGTAFVAQNCDDYLESNGRAERALLFGHDVTTYLGAVGTAVLAATHASAGVTSAFAIGTTNSLAGNDLLRKQLTFGADFTHSVSIMVHQSMSDYVAEIAKKDVATYSFYDGVNDLRGFEELCAPATIIANMNGAIATAKFAPMKMTAPGSPPSRKGDDAGGGTDNGSASDSLTTPKAGGRKHRKPTPTAQATPNASPSLAPSARILLQAVR